MMAAHPHQTMTIPILRRGIKRVSPLALGFLFPLVTAAQGSPLQRQAPVLNQAERRAVVDSVASEFTRLYVDADTGRMIANHVRERSRAGAYDALTDPRAFGEAVTADLQAVNGDRHLFVLYSPNGGFDKPGKRGIVDDTGSTAPPPSTPAQMENARRDHWRLGRVDVLSGNVGYMKVSGFEGSQQAFDATSAALKYLEGTDAMIFDLRAMGGGSGEQSNFLISHFVGADTIPSLTISNRSSGSRRVRYTLAKVPGTRRPKVPIWILTDRGTASAGEDFSFVLKNLGRARIVGDRTAGAGHNNDFVDVGNNFGVSISYTRVADPKTGREWERVGVLPDVKVDPRDAWPWRMPLRSTRSRDSRRAKARVSRWLRSGTLCSRSRIHARFHLRCSRRTPARIREGASSVWRTVR